MLAEFRVKNCRNFKNELCFSLDQVKNYEFSEKAIKNDLVKTALIYGPNGSGKSNLGFALMDISATLTDKFKASRNITAPFSNLASRTKRVDFYYKLKFDKSIVEYWYTKSSPEDLISELVKIDDETVIDYNHITKTGSVALDGTQTLNTNLDDLSISFVKYVKSNAVLKKNHVNNIFEKFIDFVENLLFFSSLEVNRYQGYKTGADSIAEGIIKKGKLQVFEQYLCMAGIKYSLSSEEVDGKKKIMCNFGKKKVDIYSIASRGTCTLTLFYYWMLELDKVSCVFIDEFDAFYHNDLARLVVQTILDRNAQALITTHNTSIMDNDLLRPDCLFNLENNKITAFANATNKDLRKAHNIEKMYRAGAFSE